MFRTGWRASPPGSRWHERRSKTLLGNHQWKALRQSRFLQDWPQRLLPAAQTDAKKSRATLEWQNAIAWCGARMTELAEYGIAFAAAAVFCLLEGMTLL